MAIAALHVGSRAIVPLSGKIHPDAALMLPREFTKIANGGSVLRSLVSLMLAFDSSAGIWA